MTIANIFIIDTWRGSKFMKTVISWDSFLVHWTTFLVFFGFPIIVASTALLLGSGDWWSITSISWFVLVVLYFVVFCFSAIFYEVDGCLELIRYHKKLRDDNDSEYSEHSLTTFRRAVQLRLKQSLSGYQIVSYTATGSDKSPDETDFGETLDKDSFETYISPLSWLTKQPFMGLFYDVLEKPVRQFNVDDVLEFTPFVTNNSWGLESIYCRRKNTRFIAIIDGVSALTKEQVRSSLACYVFGFVITLFAIVGFLSWMGASGQAILVVVILYLLSVYGSTKRRLGVNSVYKNLQTREDGSERDINKQMQSDALYQVQETYRITEPRKEMCWIVFVLSLVVFQLIPLLALLSAGNSRVAIVFFFMSLVSILRSVCNAPACLQELGSLDGIEVNNEEKDARSEWREKHRLGKIVKEISVGRRSNFWTGIFIFFLFVFCAIFLSATVLGADEGVARKMYFASKNEFVHEGSGSLNYASCSLTNNILKSPDGDENSFADFTFLSTVAYLEDAYALDAVTEWFDTDVNNLEDIVSNFKRNYQHENGISSVKYKLFEFPSQDLKIVSIRGTSNSWDTLTDAQLWSSAALAQYIRAFLPIGNVWTPILPHLIKAIAVIEDESLRDVSYYRETTAFVEFLKVQGDNVQVVGHSLGGGLAMITGAQTETPSIALSGPNAMLSRKTFYPQISVDSLNKYTFNIIPDRDPVPRIDDLAKNYQRIECKAAPNKPLDCHFGKRSLCEILYTCGSQGRPVPCFCVNDYNYDVPTSINGMSFSEVCPN